MIRTNLYGVPKSDGDGGGKTTIIMNGAASNPFEPHYLWGQYFDDTEDIDGDMTVNGDITADGDVNADKILVNNAKVIEKLEAGQIETGDLTAQNITADTAEIDNISGTNLDYEFANILSALINQLEATDIITKNLTVTGAAHFFELIIDKIKAAGGAYIFTPADGFKIDKVEPITDGYRLYFKATDGDKHIYNMWKTGDQAICKNFNEAATGVNYSISNKYYWSLVTNTNTDDENAGSPVDVNFGTQDSPDIVSCHYIDISTLTYDGTVNPETGDDIVMLGYRGNDDPQRQSAIYISAYASMDTDLVAPLICQYRGINDFSLNSHKYTWFAAGARNGYHSNQIKGNLLLENGTTIEDYIDNNVTGVTSYVLLPSVQFVTIDNNTATPQTVTVNILKNEDGVMSTLTTVPEGYVVYVYNNIDNTAVRTFRNGTIAFNAPMKASDDTTDIDYITIALSDGNITIDSKTISYIQKGATGDDGGHYEFRYKNATIQPNKPTNGTNGTSNGWSANPSTPDFANGEYTWMTQCYVSGTGAYGTWSEPIRITGANGADGEDGEDGKDGTKIEFVYTRNNTGITPSTPPYNQQEDWPNDGTTDHVTVNGVTWYDNPQGVEENMMYEYVSTRTYKNNTWSVYSTPAIWSKWGEKGQDGDGYEYIYRCNNDLTQPPQISYQDNNGKTEQDDGFRPINWSNNPLDITEEEKYEWVATRKKTNGSWGKFSTPKIWAHWSAPGTNGLDGGHYEFRYKNAVLQPATPTPNQDTDNTWSNIPAQPDYANGEYTWMTQCYVSGTGAYGTWSDPIRITGADGKDGEDGIDGVDGKDGKNGTKIEFIYTTNNTGITPATPDTTQTEDWYGTSNGVTWTDNPSGVSENMMYEFVSTRTCENDVWGAYSTPVIWSKWGEKGQDGDGYEYIFKSFTTQPTWDVNNNDNPENWAIVDEDEYHGTWNDDPVDVNSTYLYEYCSVRKKINGHWQGFSTPSLWAHWAPAGSNGGHYEFRYKNHTPTQANPAPAKPTTGTDGTSNGWSPNPSTPNFANSQFTFMTFNYVNGQGQYNEWSDPIRITGDNGKDGEDGNSTEFIYATSTSNTAPAISYSEYNSKVPSDPDFVPENWTDNPTGVDETNQYEFVSIRTQVNGIWTNNFSVPAIWSKWGEKGQDGDGFEYIYILSDNTPTISYTPNNGKTPNDDEFIPIDGWEDNPLQLSEQNQIEWVATRKKHNGVWGNFSTPKVWAHWAQPGADGGHYEFRYKNATIQPNKPTNGTNGTSNGWSATPTTPDYANGEYTWMTQSFVSGNNSYGEWSNPIRITGANGKDGEDGEDGKDGTKIEFIYTRNNTGTAPSAPPTNQQEDWPNNGITDHQTVDGVTWYDNPQGVEANMKYEYVSTRTCENNVWGDYSTPVIWSKWGEKGQDGDGFEYIYSLNISEPSNPTPNNYASNSDYQNNDEYASFLQAWSDDPLELSENNPIEWVCVRKRHNGIWDRFSDPAMWAHWSAKGSDGGHYEFRYQNAPNKPNTPTAGQNTSSPWTNTPTALTESDLLSGKVTWMTQCFVSGAGSYGTWTSPIRITGANGKDGEDGEDGQNGIYIEFIYRRFKSEQTWTANDLNPNNWAVDNTQDYIGKAYSTANSDSPNSKWTDNPRGVNETYQYEYVSTREFDGSAFNKFTTPVIWSKWGEKGQDGDGYEYIYQRFESKQTFTSNSSNPSYWGASQDEEYTGPSGSGWYDDPKDVTSVYKYEYCAVRKKNNGTWGKFSDPALWAKFGENGADGGHYEFRYQNAILKPTKPTTGQNASSPWTTTPSELSASDLGSGKVTWMTQCFVENNIYGIWTDPIRITGAQGKAGEDGNDGNDGSKIEFIYRRFKDKQTWTSNDLNPSNWTAQQTDDYIGKAYYTTNSDSPDNKWTDNPRGITETYLYEYVSIRYYKLDNGTMKWGKFTEPVIWSKWGDKGQDGDGYEYIYKHFSEEQTWKQNNNNPAYWSASQSDEYYGPSGYTWNDDPEGVSETYKYEYCAVRKKTNGSWGKFSTPALWARYSEKGSDGGHYEFRYQNAPNKPSTPTAGQNTSSPWTTTPSALSESDLASGKVTWMTQCFVSGAGVYGTWTEPIRITGAKGADGEDGDDGNDGSKIEFIYKLFDTEQTFGSNYNNPSYWSAQQTDDYLGPSDTYKWNDNPQGISETHKYEYVSVRYYKLDNGTMKWGKFTDPVLWSKWGDKGQDGDGVEYIFCLTESKSTTPKLWKTSTEYTNGGANTNPTYVTFSNSKITSWYGKEYKNGSLSSSSKRHNITDSDYLPPNCTLHDINNAPDAAPVTTWTDEPSGVSAAKKCEWVSQRKYDGATGTWSDFSTPVVWAIYAEGVEGPAGPQGDDGKDYEGYFLVDNGSSLIAAINSTYNPIRRTVITINFKVVHQTGANIETITSLSGYYCRYKLNTAASWSTPTKDNTNGTFTATSDIAWSDSHRYVTVELYKGSSASGTYCDTYTLYSVMEPKSILDTSYGLYSLVQGHTTSINTINNNYSTLNQTMTGIQTEVGSLGTEIDALSGEVSGLSTDISLIDQKADSISSMVTRYSGVQLIDQNAWINADETSATINWDLYKVSIKGTKEIGSTITSYYVYSGRMRLIANREYIFSIYPASTSSSFSVEVWYNTTMVKQKDFSNQVSSITVATLNNDTYAAESVTYKRKTYKFTAPATAYYTIKVKYNGAISFYCPQLENGDAATAFDATSMCTSSQITQTADRISLLIANCGIDIEKGMINLNADTTNIFGNLNLRRTDNGMTVYDTDNNPRISIKPTNVPVPTAGDNVFSSKGYVQISSAKTYKQYSSEVNAKTEKKSIGYYASGNSVTLTISPTIYGITKAGTYVDNNISQIKCTVKLYRGTLTSAAYTSEEKTIYRTSNNAGGYDYPSFTWTINSISTAGTYNVEVTITASDTSTGYSQYQIYAFVEYEKQVTSLTYIGLDGLLVGSTNNHFAKITKDGFELRWIGTTNNIYGGTSVKLDNNGLKRVYNFDVNNGPLSWVSFDGYTKATVLTSSDFTRTSFYYGSNYITEYNYIMKADDVIIFIDESLNNFSSSSNLYIRLGDGVGGTNSSLSLVGRHICIRNFSAKTVYVCSGETSSGYCILDRDDHDYVDRWNTEHAFCTFMSIPTMIKNNYSMNWCCAQRA